MLILACHRRSRSHSVLSEVPLRTEEKMPRASEFRFIENAKTNPAFGNVNSVRGSHPATSTGRLSDAPHSIFNPALSSTSTPIGISTTIVRSSSGNFSFDYPFDHRRFTRKHHSTVFGRGGRNDRMTINKRKSSAGVVINTSVNPPSSTVIIDFLDVNASAFESILKFLYTERNPEVYTKGWNIFFEHATIGGSVRLYVPEIPCGILSRRTVSRSAYCGRYSIFCRCTFVSLVERGRDEKAFASDPTQSRKRTRDGYSRLIEASKELVLELLEYTTGVVDRGEYSSLVDRKTRTKTSIIIWMTRPSVNDFKLSISDVDGSKVMLVKRWKEDFACTATKFNTSEWNAKKRKQN